jgi:hypothetical protein
MYDEYEKGGRMKKAFFAVLLVGLMLTTSVYGTVIATAKQSTNSVLSTSNSVEQGSISGSYTGSATGCVEGYGCAATSTTGSFSGSATFTFDGNMITGEGSGTGSGQFSGYFQGPYSAAITQGTCQLTLKGNRVTGTYAADVAIAGAGPGDQHATGPVSGTFDRSTMLLKWSYDIKYQGSDVSIVAHVVGSAKVLLPPVADLSGRQKRQIVLVWQNLMRVRQKPQLAGI